MPRRTRSTVDTIFSSSHIHFTLAARTRWQETVLCFQTLAIFYLFPLSSVDLYVLDTGWFIRHNYFFISLLKDAEYIRVDPLDPHDYNSLNSFDHSYLRVRPLRDLEASISSVLNFNSEDRVARTPINLGLIPPWEPLLVMLSSGSVVGSPETLLSQISDVNFDGIKDFADKKVLILSPYRRLLPVDGNRVSCVYSDILNDNQCSKDESRIVFPLRTVQELLRIPSGHRHHSFDHDDESEADAHKYELIDFIDSTAAWNSLATFFKSTSGIDEIIN
jgi:hypothetical protein